MSWHVHICLSCFDKFFVPSQLQFSKKQQKKHTILLCIIAISYLSLHNNDTTKFKVQNNTHLWPYSFWGLGLWAQLSRVLWARSHQLQSRCPLGWSPIRDSAIKALLPNWYAGWQLPVPVVVGLWASASCCESARGHFQLPSCGPFHRADSTMATGFFKAIRGASHKVSVTVLCALMTSKEIESEAKSFLRNNI